VIGYFIRCQHEFGLKRMALLAVSLVVLFFMHVTAFGATVLVVTALTITSAVSRWKITRLTKKASLLPFVAIVPGAILLLLFFARHMPQSRGIENLHLAAWRIYSVAPLASCSDLEYLFGNMLALLIGVLTVLAIYLRWRKRGALRLDALLI